MKKIKVILKRIVLKTLHKLSFSDILKEHESSFYESKKGINVKIYPVYKIFNSAIGDYTYISQGATIKNTIIGKFCSIGPNLLCGWGIHPVDKLTTSPMFYSTLKQNGVSLSESNKVIEELSISIGNDVFIGMNVVILDGVSIGDGAVIGAGAVVSKNIPPYAIAVGNPINVIKYRFEDDQIEALLKIKWWNFSSDDLKSVELHFSDVNAFIKKYSK